MRSLYRPYVVAKPRLFELGEPERQGYLLRTKTFRERHACGTQEIWPVRSGFPIRRQELFRKHPLGSAHAVLSEIILKPFCGRPESDSMSRLLDIAALYSRESTFLTLGNQVNQLAAIAYLNRLDHAFHELARAGWGWPLYG